jgi:hypothetical protein
MTSTATTPPAAPLFQGWPCEIRRDATSFSIHVPGANRHSGLDVRGRFTEKGFIIDSRSGRFGSEDLVASVREALFIPEVPELDRWEALVRELWTSRPRGASFDEQNAYHVAQGPRLVAFVEEVEASPSSGRVATAREAALRGYAALLRHALDVGETPRGLSWETFCLPPDLALAHSTGGFSGPVVGWWLCWESGDWDQNPVPTRFCSGPWGYCESQWGFDLIFVDDLLSQ